MNRKGASLPAGYEVLVQGAGPHDIAIHGKAKVELMKSSKEQRAAMAGAIQSFAAGGFGALPARMRRIEDAQFPPDGARRTVRLTTLTPIDVSCFGVLAQVQGRPTYLITGIELCDASANGTRAAWTAAGEEALRVRWEAQDEGGPHDAVSASR